MTKTLLTRQDNSQQSPHFQRVEGLGQQHVHIWISDGVYLALERLAKCYGITKKDMLEKLIVDEDEKVLHGTNLESAEGQRYLSL
jgi:hypothetical protein